MCTKGFVEKKKKYDYAYKCDTCGKVFKSLKYLKEFVKSHINPDRYQCTSCDDKNTIREPSSNIHQFLIEENKLNAKRLKLISDIDSKLHFDININEKITKGNVKLVHRNRLPNHTYCFTDFKLRKKRKYRQVSLPSENKINETSTTIHVNEDEDLLPFLHENIGRIETVLNVNTNYSKETVLEIDHRKYQDPVYRYKIESVPKFVCNCCKKILFSEQTRVIASDNPILKVAQVTVNDIVCNFCFNKLKNNILPSTSVHGNKLDPCNIPSCLKELTFMEKKLISKIHVFLTIIVLPGGQLAEKGMVINFPVSIENNIDYLPRNYSNTNVFTMSYGENSHRKPTHMIRKDKIIKALLWLKKYNILYEDIKLNFSMLNNTLENENIPMNISEMEQFAAISINYTAPNINIAKLINSKTPHIVLPKCKENPVNIYERENGYFDGRFRKNSTYMLQAVNNYEFMRLLNSVNIHMRMMKNKLHVRVQDVRNLNQNPDLLTNSYMFMKNIRGTAAYWKNNLLNLLAMFKNLGTPSLFMTLSANDMHWTEVIMTLKQCSYEEACTIQNALLLVKEDPYLTALHFQRRFKALLNHVINGKLAPLGKVKDYFCRVEFQNRSSPHMHIFFWIENFKSIFNHREKLLEYINATISTRTPIDSPHLSSLVKKYQTHGHSNYCLHKTGRCRFGFPYKPCTDTKLVSNLEVASDKTKNASSMKLQEIQVMHI
ncbi:unnamed protein product [Mytilus coruscus]|uniref:C2H2-type domain-containing protein n=1 Tax=Mytilus coruscus TaxID=42192 RepID=A0A6J8DJD5_MYTCO|nr:unnamed protein product [Mytilus coruscus]